MYIPFYFTTPPSNIQLSVHSLTFILIINNSIHQTTKSCKNAIISGRVINKDNKICLRVLYNKNDCRFSADLEFISIKSSSHTHVKKYATISEFFHHQNLKHTSGTNYQVNPGINTQMNPGLHSR